MIPSRNPMKQVARIDREQRDFLVARLREVRDSAPFNEFTYAEWDKRRTAREKRAAKIDAKFERRMRRENRKRARAFDVLETRVMREALFGSVQKALALIDKAKKNG